MRVLFVLKQLGYVRHFDVVAKELAQRGHLVRLAAQDGETALPESLRGVANVSVVACPNKRSDEWAGHASLIRRGGDYLRYLEPPFLGATKLRARAFEKLAGSLSAHERAVPPGLSDAALGLAHAERQRLRDLVRTVERAIPSDPRMDAFLADEAPDLVVITPLIDLGSGQTDIVKSTTRLGIPSAMALFSWDNLTTKGVVHDLPDRVLVWNERQRDEARTLHGVPDDRIRITGAPRFDPFFALKPAVDRETWLTALGLDPAAPTVLYLGSSKFVAERERVFVDRWLAALRGSAHGSLAGCNVVVKPHPDVNRVWEAPGAERVVLGDSPGVSALVSRVDGDPRTVVVQGRFTAAQVLFECLVHADAVVALNTSAELEAGILGKPVLTLPAGDDVADGQENTLHYHYLLKDHGGHVERAPTIEAHLEALSAAIARRSPIAPSPFILDFLRPRGSDRVPTALFVDELEALAAAGPPRVTEGTAATPVERPTSGIAGSQPGEKVRLDYEGCPVWLLVTSPLEARWRVRACAKEPWTVAWLERLVATDVLFDIGANVGAFSLLATRRLDRQLRVVAFEPGYATFAKLCDNIVLNGCDAVIMPVSIPLWSSTAITAFKYRSLDPGQSRHAMKARRPFRTKDSDRDRTAQTRYVQPMLSMALDDMMASYELPAPTHIKLDVDGAELHVLQGASRLLRRPELRSILIEIDRELIDEVTAGLVDAGFEQHAVHARESKAHGPVYCEFARA